MIVNELPILLKDGFTEKFAKFYLDALKQEENSTLYEQAFVKWAHTRGFLAEHASAYGINEENYHEYLSDYDFYKTWPLNSWARIWVNDKLTLKHMLSSTEFDYLLPKYYYYTMPDGLRPCMDNHLPNPETFESFIQLLKSEKDLACKPNNDSMSKGFCHLEYRDNHFYINGEISSENELRGFVETHPNYVFQEYIRPSMEFHAISPLIHTLRVLVINQNGVDPKIVRCYLRFPCKYTGEANYVTFTENNADLCLLYADVDEQSGWYGNAKLIYANRIESVSSAPDTGAPLTGVITDFEKLKDVIKAIARRFNIVEYMGFDIGITDKGFRMMEINTHPGIAGFQYFRSMYEDSFVKQYFEAKLQRIDSLSAESIVRRNAIPR